MPDLSSQEGQEVIETLIESDTALVVIDNLSAWCRTGKENEGESWQPIAGWLMSLRRRGHSVLVVHHAGKNGEQRGSSRREDILDVVMKLSRPSDYSEEQGSVFNLEFSKARNLHGDAAASLLFELKTDANNERANWSCTPLELATFERVIALHGDGISQNDIDAELEINKSTVSRHLKKARKDGRIADKESGKS